MKKELIALAACSIDLAGTVPTEIQLTPAGTFKAKDGRPVGLSGWILNNENAQAVIQLANSQADAFVIDYDHLSLYAKQNGVPAIAAGWFKNLQYREGLGLFATQVEWTDSAALAIKNKEYRYISPVLSFEPKTGVITKIHMAALTNSPALDGMKDLTVLAADYFSTQQDSDMEKIKELEDKIVALTAQLSEKDEKIAALSAVDKTVDLSSYMPIADVKPLQEQITALSTQLKAKEDAEIASDIKQTIEAALSDGRLLVAQKEWAQKLGESNLAALKEYVSVATPIDALSGTQTGGKPPAGETTALKVKVPTGWGVDESQAALHQEIAAYQKQNGVDYTTAAIAIGA
jgi:phage I-like protein